jgi:hypothetical protein
MFRKGDLVRIIKAPDQDKYFMKHLIDKIGIVVEWNEYSHSPNIWKIFIIEDERIISLHKLDLEKIQ